MMAVRSLVVGSLGLAVALPFACSSDPPPAGAGGGTGVSGETVTVTPEAGGTLTSKDGRLTITVPPGAVTTPTEIWVDTVPADRAVAEFPDAIPNGVVYELGPDGQQFALPVQVALTLDLDDVPTTVDGVPWMGLMSRSASTGDEELTAASVEGEPLEEPAPVTLADFSASTVAVLGDTTHFSEIWGQQLIQPGVSKGLYATLAPTNIEACIDEQWVSTFKVRNGTDNTHDFVFAAARSYGCTTVENIDMNASPEVEECFDQLVAPVAFPPDATNTLVTGFKCVNDGKTVLRLDSAVIRQPAQREAYFRGLVSPDCKLCPPLLANGQPCTTADECASGQCVDSVCCDAVCDGTCVACDVSGSVGACSNVPTGQSDATCTAPSACDSGGCRAPNGASCTGGLECVSGNCADGTCCDTTCTGTCSSCAVSPNEGTCSDVPAGQADPDSCLSPGMCDGSGLCGNQGQGGACSVGAECASNYCVDGVCCDTLCNAPCVACTAAKKGGGSDGTCGALADATDPDDECADPAVCYQLSGSCKKPLGSPCTMPPISGNCVSGNCVDGFCCQNQCTLGCRSCAFADTGQVDGTCTFVTAGMDPGNDCTAPTPNCDGAGSCM